MQHRTRFGPIAPVSLTLALALAACSDTSGPDDGSAAFEVRAATHGPAIQTGSGLEVEIGRVLLVIGRVKLEKAATTSEDFVDERSVVIELVPGEAPELVFSADVPEGTFKELEIAVDKLEPGHPEEQTLIDLFPALRDASLLIEGTVEREDGGEPFAFASDLDIDLELTFDPPLAVIPADGGSVLTSLVLDVSTWFLGDTGEVLDPADPANRSRIEGNVQRSIELYEGMHFPGN